ncbi:MAG: ABC transporter permease [Myxococcales bacterium]|nr:ABC transporter permease [Myxococcota bacterium]MDW8284128.1 ABC transporter permease [Myxococcales bacterium]
MRLAAFHLRAVGVLVQRDLLRFFRQRSRVVGALLQPLLFWLVIGSGLSGSFRMPGASSVDYVQYFYPGVVLLVVLFTSIFTTMSVIEDRQHGFLQAVLVAPSSRLSLVLGKTLGGVTIALVQAAALLLLAPLAGFPWRAIHWPLVLAVLLLSGVALSALGFALAWSLNSTQGYHVVMSLLLIPLWVISGAMFPAQGAPPWLARLMQANPLSHAVASLRRALYGPAYQEVLGPGSTAAFELGVLLVFALVTLSLAVGVCSRRPR